MEDGDVNCQKKKKELSPSFKFSYIFSFFVTILIEHQVNAGGVSIFMVHSLRLLYGSHFVMSLHILYKSLRNFFRDSSVSV